MIEKPSPSAADYHRFYKACVDDKPISEVIAIGEALWDHGHSIHIISGRSDEVRSETMEWLIDNFPTYSTLYMRRAGDQREDYEVKRDLYHDLLSNLRLKPGQISGVFDDGREEVIDMWRGEGLTVFYVNRDTSQGEEEKANDGNA